MHISEIFAAPLGWQSEIKRSDFFWPLAVIACLTTLAITLGIHFAIGVFDRASEAREQTLAQNGITQRVAEVAQMIVPQTDWDDAISNLDNRFDKEWALSNIGIFLSQSSGFDRSFVLDANNRPIFAAHGAKAVPAAEYQPVDPLAAKLVHSVRQQEARRGPVRPNGSAEMTTRPIQASSLKMSGDDLFIVTATLVQPDFGTALPSGPRSPVVVTMMAIDSDFLAQFSSRFLLNGVHVRRLDQRPIAGETEITARDEAGRVISYFAWRPLNPGYLLLRQLLPQIGIVALLLLAIAFTQLRRISRLADQLIERDAWNRVDAWPTPREG